MSLPAAAPGRPARLSPAALESLRRLHRRLPASPAREALKTLLDHQLAGGKPEGKN